MSERSKKFWGSLTPKNLAWFIVILLIGGIIISLATNLRFYFGVSQSKEVAFREVTFAILIAGLSIVGFHRFSKGVRQKKNNWLDGVAGMFVLLIAVWRFIAAAPNLVGGK